MKRETRPHGIHLFNLAKSKKYHDLIEVLTLASTVDDIDYQNENGNTTLHWAAFAGEAATVEQLLKKGANLTAENNNGITPIEWAIQQNHKDVMVVLLRFIDINNAEHKQVITKALGLAKQSNNITLSELLHNALKPIETPHVSPIQQSTQKSSSPNFLITALIGLGVLSIGLLVLGICLYLFTHISLAWLITLGSLAVVGLLVTAGLGLNYYLRNRLTQPSAETQLLIENNTDDPDVAQNSALVLIDRDSYKPSPTGRGNRPAKKSDNNSDSKASQAPRLGSS